MKGWSRGLLLRVDKKSNYKRKQKNQKVLLASLGA